MNTLCQRLELAMSRAGETRQSLAEELGVTRQALYPSGSMAGDKLAKASRFLHCDLYWLCTGEGGKYVPEDSFAVRIATVMQHLPQTRQLRVYELVVLMAQGKGPK